MTTPPFSPSRVGHRLSVKRATVRLLLSLGVGLVTVVGLTPSHIAWWLRAIAGWDAGALTLTALLWTIIITADAPETRRRAGGDDPGRKMVFLIAVASSLVSLFAAGVVLRGVKSLPSADRDVWTALAFAAVILSWTVTHTAYTLKYAHLYYRESDSRDAPSSGGLQFPGTEEPADLDFAYFAFTVGMCFQVSDVMVVTSRIRREVLVHATLSFVYNTTIIALALNVALSLLS